MAEIIYESTTPENVALGKRAVKAARWRWIDGMKHPTARGEKWVAWGGRYSSGAMPATAIPDLTDPATLGCLAALSQAAYDPRDPHSAARMVQALEVAGG